jgi:hypothetical protein
MCCYLVVVAGVVRQIKLVKAAVVLAVFSKAPFTLMRTKLLP